MTWAPIVVIAALGLVGCAGIFEKGGEVADEILVAGEAAVCRASTIGAVRRRYGISVEAARVYAAFCRTPVDSMLLAGRPDPLDELRQLLGAAELEVLKKRIEALEAERATPAAPGG